MNADYQIDDARVVGREYHVTLAMLVEYEFSVVAGFEPDSALEVADELARFSNLEKTQPVERDTIHTEADVLRDIYEDDVEAGELEWMDEPTAPSPDTYWDDTRHFGDGDRELRADGGVAVDETVRKFTARHLSAADDSAELTLEEAWAEYRPRYPTGVPRERFRWHLEQTLPESVTVEKPPTRDEIAYLGLQCSSVTATGDN